MKNLIILLTMLTAISSTAFANGFYSNNTTFYDKNGGYDGRVTENYGGGYTYYDRNGGYAGRATPNYGGGYTYYDKNGGYAGRSR